MLYHVNLLVVSRFLYKEYKIKLDIFFDSTKEVSQLRPIMQSLKFVGTWQYENQAKF